LGEILVGGGIGYIIDRNTGAGFDYPSTIVIMLRKIGEAVGILEPLVSKK
jgi:F0F1-type ATP synthase assembly protein I